MSSKKDKIIELLRQDIPYSQIVQATGCSKSTVSYHAKKIGLSKPETCLPTKGSKTNERKKKIKYTVSKDGKKKYHCVWCGAFLSTQRMYCEYSCEKEHKISEGLIKNASNAQSVISWRQRQKLRAVEYKGGKCALCGYSRCVAALHFHHVDPSTKSFSISSKGISRAWSVVVLELDKCVMLCSNCHSEVHAGYSKLPCLDSNEECCGNNAE